MKKLFISLFAVILILTFAGCGGSGTTESGESSGNQSSSDMIPDELMPSDDEVASTLDEDSAKQKALEHADIMEAEIADFKIELDQENGTSYYDITFKHDGHQYDYQVHAESGEILKSNKTAIE